VRAKTYAKELHKLHLRQTDTFHRRQSMDNEQSFSERQGLVRPPDIEFTSDLPKRLREPIISLLNDHIPSAFLWERIEFLFNPYGIAAWPPSDGESISTAKDEDNPDFVASRRVLLNCPWFRVYDVIEDVFAQLSFHEEQLRTDPDEELRAYPLHHRLNDYFRHAGIGWQMVDGKIIARGDDAFERSVHKAESDLAASGRTTAADRIGKAIRNLSARPEPDYSGAISHATGAIECVLNDITGEQMTLGAYLKRHTDLFPPSIKKALDGIWGYSSEEGARHGQEGVEPPGDDAEFVVALSAAVTTFLNRKHPRT
jgi:hypothetical protein